MADTKRPYADLSDEQLDALAEEYLLIMDDANRQREQAGRNWSDANHEYHHLTSERHWRKRERTPWRPQGDGFYLVRTGENTSEAYSVSGDGRYIRRISDDAVVSWDSFAPGTQFKRFTTEDGYL